MPSLSSIPQLQPQVIGHSSCYQATQRIKNFGLQILAPATLSLVWYLSVFWMCLLGCKICFSIWKSKWQTKWVTFHLSSYLLAICLSIMVHPSIQTGPPLKTSRFSRCLWWLPTAVFRDWSWPASVRALSRLYRGLYRRYGWRSWIICWKSGCIQWGTNHCGTWPYQMCARFVSLLWPLEGL